MGSRMAANLVRGGFSLVACTRTEAKGQAWADEHGVDYEHDPAQVAARSDIVITMVVDGEQVESILGNDEFIAALKPGTLCIDMSTIGPPTSVAIGERLAAAGASFLDAPVTGSSPKAEDGTLTIMVGGAREDFERARPVLEAMGKTVVHVGPTGHGSTIKLINNTLAAANTVAVGEALLLAKARGIDLDALTQIVAVGSGASAMLELKSRPMREHDYATLFKLDHMLKDVRLCLDEAQAAGMRFPAGEHAQRQLAESSSKGHGDDDFAALIEALEAAAGFRL